MDAGRFLVEAHLRDARSVSELARVHGVHRGWPFPTRDYQRRSA